MSCNRDQFFWIRKTKQYSNLFAVPPLWGDNSKSSAVVKNFLDVIKDAVNFLNSGETSVVAYDQPLFAIAKMIQWHYHVAYGRLVMVMVQLQQR